MSNFFHCHTICERCGSHRFWYTSRGTRKCRSRHRERVVRAPYPIHGFRLSRTAWFQAIEAFLTRETVRSVEERCRCSHQTATNVVAVIRETMTRDIPALFSGTYEADETYVGGQWKNKAVHIRRQGTKRGRGTSKQAVFGIACRERGMVCVWLVPNAKHASLIPIIRDTVVPGSSIFTDGLGTYRALPRYGYHHDWVDHDAGEYVRGDVHTQTIDGFWGVLKNRLAATGGIRKAYLPRFVGEHVWRYNHRTLSLKTKVRWLYRQVKISGRS